jgi:talin
MVTNVTSLLKTVKAVEDEHTRGTRALESTIEVIGQEIRVLIIIFYNQSYNWNINKYR